MMENKSPDVEPTTEQSLVNILEILTNAPTIPIWVEYTSLIIAFLAALAAIVASVLAFVAVRQNVSDRQQAKQDRLLEIKQNYYKALAFEPTVNELKFFQQDVEALFTTSDRKLCEISDEDQSANLANECIGQWIAEFNKHIQKFSLRLASTADALGNEELKDNLTLQLTEFQNEINVLIEKAQVSRSESEYMTTVKKHVSAILGIIMRHDPLFSKDIEKRDA